MVDAWLFRVSENLATAFVDALCGRHGRSLIVQRMNVAAGTCDRVPYAA